MKSLKSVNRFPEGTGCSLLLAAFGGCVILAGHFFTGVFQDGWKAIWEMPFQLFVVLGATLTWTGLSQARLHSRFGTPAPTISVDAVTPGEEFGFCYTLPIRRDTRIESIHVFLVLRERISYPNGDDTAQVDMDRLYQAHEQPGRSYRKGEAVEIQQSFCVPKGDRGIRNSYMDRKNVTLKRMWVVKVRLHPSEPAEVWGEYDLEVPFVDQPASLPDPEQFEVVLREVPFTKILNTTPMLRTIMPHLREGQIGDLCRDCPCLLMENVTHREAQNAQLLLEAAGAKATICAPMIARKVGDTIELGP